LTDGILLVDKPAGVTSHDVVARIRRGLGRGTRIQRFLMELPKRYETVAQLGYTSTTGDPEGEIVAGTMPGELQLPTGVIRQRPPAYSAVKIGGKRAYALARAGETVEIPEREVTVTRFEQLWRDGERVAFAIECSSGTYVRSLVMDLHDAYCVELRRTHIGAFDVADADEERLIGLDDALNFLPVVDIEGDAASKAAHGVAVPGHAKGIVRLRDEEGLIALAEPRGGAMLKPVVGFRG
jgi:tRNA pseudouridine55 synthase